MIRYLNVDIMNNEHRTQNLVVICAIEELWLVIKAVHSLPRRISIALLVILVDCLQLRNCPGLWCRARHPLRLTVLTRHGAGQVDGEHVTVFHVGRGLQMISQYVIVIQYFPPVQ